MARSIYQVSLDEDTGQTIISGMGELHLDIYVERMKREYKVDVDVGQPRVNFREAISKRADFDYLHKKQSGIMLSTLDPDTPRGWLFLQIVGMNNEQMRRFEASQCPAFEVFSVSTMIPKILHEFHGLPRNHASLHTSFFLDSLVRNIMLRCQTLWKSSACPLVVYVCYADTRTYDGTT